MTGCLTQGLNLREGLRVAGACADPARTASPPSQAAASGNINDLIAALFGFACFPIQDKPLCRPANRQLPRIDEDAWGIMLFDEVHEMGRYGMAIVRHQNPILFGAQPEDFSVVRARVQAQFRRTLKIDGPKTLHGPQ